MNLKRASEIFRSPAGRAIGAVLGLSIIAVLVLHSDFTAIQAALLRTGLFFPWVLLLEGGSLSCSVLALRVLYAEDKKVIPGLAWVRAALIGYAVMGMMPAGRAVAEATRAGLLARYVSGGRAAGAAMQSQSIVLLANAAISIPCAMALFSVVGLSLTTVAVVVNFGITVIGGIVVLRMTRSTFIREKLTRWLNGAEFGVIPGAAGKSLLIRAFAWEFLSRLFQVVQNGVLVFAVSGAVSGGSHVLRAFCSEGLYLVGVALGELIPAQLGATELSYQYSAHALGITAADGLVIALLAHAAQLVWIMVGGVVMVVSPYFRVENRAVKEL